MSGTSNITIHDLPVEERPREKLMRLGVQALANRELIAILLGSGSAHESALALADRLLAQFGGLAGLARTSPADLRRTDGIGEAKAAQISGAFELGKRLACYVGEEPPAIHSPDDVAALVMAEMRHLDKEHFRVIMLNTRNRVIGTK